LARAEPWAQHVREGRPRLFDRAPALAKSARRPCRAPLRGLFVRPSPPHRGSFTGSCRCAAHRFVTARRALFALGSLAPMTRRAGGEKARRVARMDASQFVVRAGRPVDKPRNPHAYPKGATSGWPFSWLLLFGHAKRSNPAVGRRTETLCQTEHLSVVRANANARNQRAKVTGFLLPQE